MHGICQLASYCSYRKSQIYAWKVIISYFLNDSFHSRFKFLAWSLLDWVRCSYADISVACSMCDAMEFDLQGFIT